MHKNVCTLTELGASKKSLRTAAILSAYSRVVFIAIHRLLYKWTVHGKSPSITMDPITVQNESRLIDFFNPNFVNSRNFFATTLRFSEKFDQPFSHILMFGNTFMRFTVSFLCRAQAVSKIHVPIIYRYLISEGRRDEIDRACVEQ